MAITCGSTSSKPAVIRTYIPAESYDPATVDRIRDGLWHLGQMRSVGELTVTRAFGGGLGVGLEGTLPAAPCE